MLVVWNATDTVVGPYCGADAVAVEHALDDVTVTDENVPVTAAACTTVTLPDGTAPITSCSVPFTLAAPVDDTSGPVALCPTLATTVADPVSVTLPCTVSVLSVATVSVALDATGTVDVHAVPTHEQLGSDPQADVKSWN